MKYFLILSVLLSGCCLYRMPEEDEFSTVPITNNPSITRERCASPLSGM